MSLRSDGGAVAGALRKFEYSQKVGGRCFLKLVGSWVFCWGMVPHTPGPAQAIIGLSGISGEPQYVLITQLCPTLCNSMACSPPDSFALGILQARILESVAIPFFSGSSQPRN